MLLDLFLLLFGLLLLGLEEPTLGLTVAQDLREHKDYDTRRDAMAEERLIVQEPSLLLV